MFFKLSVEKARALTKEREWFKSEKAIKEAKNYITKEIKEAIDEGQYRCKIYFEFITFEEREAVEYFRNKGFKVIEGKLSSTSNTTWVEIDWGN